MKKVIFTFMAETGKAIDRACEDAGTTLSAWEKSLTDDERKQYRDVTAEFRKTADK